MRGLKERGAVFYPANQESIEGVFMEKSKALQNAAKEISHLYTKSDQYTYTPKFSVLDKGDVAQKIFWDILRDRPKKVGFVWPAEHMQATVSNEVFVEWYRERVKRKIYAQILWPHSQQYDPTKAVSEKPKVDMRDVRILPKEIDVSMAFAVYGSKVAYLSSKRENYGFIVDSIEQADLMQNQFDYLWSVSKKY